jgi:two-component system, NarL family, response regulator DevR
MTPDSKYIKVLTVDDCPAIAERLKILVEEVAGVLLIGNADRIPTALGLTDREKPEVVILDISLCHDKPRNGIDLLVILRKSYPQMKIMMLTNMSDRKYRDQCKSCGADYFFDKSEEFYRVQEVLAEMIALS